MFRRPKHSTIEVVAPKEEGGGGDGLTSHQKKDKLQKMSVQPFYGKWPHTCYCGLVCKPHMEK